MGALVRIWSLHPAHLDRMGLLACWRETLLAQAVLRGRTEAYRAHPQLDRFRAHADPLAALGAYLRGVADEAHARGYRFDSGRILRPEDPASHLDPIAVTTGQLAYEWAHLGRKLEARDPEYAARWASTAATAHPLFRARPGGVEPWERPDPSLDVRGPEQ